MTELEIIIDTPIGALLFVSSVISVFAMIAILILKKGTESHNILGYLYFFGIGFTNYASTMAYYDGLLPISTIMVSVPISTLFMIMGIVLIIPREKTEKRIKGHIICMIVTTAAFSFGIITQWYHFKISILSIFQWADFRAVGVFSLPLLVIGFLTALHFLSDAHNLSLKYLRASVNEEESISSDAEIELTPQVVSSRPNSDIIYQKEEVDIEANLAQRS